MRHLSEYQKSSLGLLDITQWQLRDTELLEIVQEPLSKQAASKQTASERLVSKQPLSEETPENRLSEEQLPASVHANARPEKAKVPETIFVDEALLVGMSDALLDDLSVVMSQLDIPFKVTDTTPATNLQYKLAVIPENGKSTSAIAESEIRYQKTLSAQQKKQLWAALLNWHRTE